MLVIPSTVTDSAHIAHALTAIRAQIRTAEQRFGREPNAVTLLAVSKTKPVEAIRAACDAGQRAFGENQVQDALPKITARIRTDLQWHFIGQVQANKTRAIAAHFDWVHSIDRAKVAMRLSQQRDYNQPPLNVCLQVNLSNELTKSGIHPQQLPALAAAVVALPKLRLRGLMVLPAPAAKIEVQRIQFRELRQLLEGLNIDGYCLDTLSMGMSLDMEAAIAEGASIVRIGTAIFGKRSSTKDT